MNKIEELFNSKIEVLNVGLELFTQSFVDLEISCVQVEWKPEAGGNQKLLDALSLLEDM